MPTSRHPQKRCPSSPGPARPRPLVTPGDPPYRHTPRPAAHPACPHHRLVMLATRPPSQRTTFASEATNATVMLVRKVTPDKVLERLRAEGIRGEVLKTSLSNEQEAALRKALSEAEAAAPTA